MNTQAFLDKNYNHGTDGKVTVEQHINALFSSEQISNEGFGDIFTEFLKGLSEPGKPSVMSMTGGWLKKREAITATLEKTYLNEQWLAKRRLQTGTSIKLDDSFSFIGLDGVIRLDGLEPAIEDYLAKLSKVSEHYSRYLRGLDIEFQRASKHLSSDLAGLTLFHVSDFRKQLERSPLSVSVDYRTVFGNTHVSRITTPLLDSAKSFNSTKLKERQYPALSADDIVKTCRVILELSKGLDILADLKNDLVRLKGRGILIAYAHKLDTYIMQEKSRQYRSRTGPTPKPIEIYTEPHEEFLALIKTVNQIPNELIQFHVKHTDALVRAFARLIDGSVR